MKIKRTLSIVLVFLMMAGVLPASVSVYAEPAGTYSTGDIAVINRIIDTNGLGWTKAPADGSSVPGNWLGVVWSGAASNRRVTGLLVSNSSLSGTLNVSSLAALASLDCYGNKLTGLNITGCLMLQTLDCGRNQLTALDVSKNTALISVKCHDNQLTKLDVGFNTALTCLWCGNNQLAALNLSKNTNLVELDCVWNELTQLDVRSCSALSTLSCAYNYFSAKSSVSGYDKVANLSFDPQFVPTSSVKLNSSQKEVTVDSSIALVATISPATATEKTVIWKSSKTSVATVDDNGKVTAKAPGFATITATTKQGGKTATCAITVKPKRTTSLKAAVVSATSVKISWGKVANVSGYQVHRATSQNGTYKSVKTTTSTSFTNTGLTSGKTYYYKVRTYKTVDGKKIYGDYSSIIVSVKPTPLKVTGVKAVKVKSGQAKISWSKQANVSGYQILRATSKTGTYKSVATTTKLNYTNKKLTAGKKYYYKVRAYKTVSGKKVYGEYSSIKSVKV